MNINKFMEILKKYNNGVFRGSKRKLAKELGCNETTISNISSGRAKPSEELVKAMAKVLKLKEEDLSGIFSISYADNSMESTNYINENNLLKERIKFLEEKNLFLEKQVIFLQEQIDFYKEKYKK